MSKRKNYYEINKKIKLFKESNKHETEDEQPNSNVAGPSFASNSANDFRVSNENEIIDTIDDLNVSVDNEAQIAFNNDQIVVREEVDHGVSSECEHVISSDSEHEISSDSENDGDICEEMDNFTTNLSSSKFKEDLTQWYVENNITKSSLKSLLHILKPYHPELPTHPDTFLKSENTPNQYAVESFPDGGKFVYFGIRQHLLNVTDVPGFAQSQSESIKLDINMDGCPIFKSANSSVWPILGSISNSFCYNPCSSTVFIIGIYYG